MNKKLVIIDPNNFCSHFEKIYKDKYIYVGKRTSSSLSNISTINFDYNLNNQVVIVTGASKGLGYEVAKYFLKYGSNLVICSRNLIEIKKAYKKLNRIKKEMMK